MEPMSEDREKLVWNADEKAAGERIDKHATEYAAALLGNRADFLSRSFMQEWIRDGFVTVNGKTVKPNYRLSPGDRVEMAVPVKESEPVAKPEPIPLDIVHEDDDIIVVNKPRGLVVHPAPGHDSGTLVHALLHYCSSLSTINGPLRPGIVHRIDRDTSGLLVAAKNNRAHKSLVAQLSSHTVTRKYTAVVHGRIPHAQGTIDAPIGRAAHDRKLYTVTEHNGKPAVTHFAVLEIFGDYSLVELRLETGRTHQIRVHMKFIGYPLVGDPVYGPSRTKIRRMNGQALHAGVLGFQHPKDGRYVEFSAPLPDDMKELISWLKSNG